MGGSYGTPKPEKTSAMLQAYAQYLPDVLRATAEPSTDIAQRQLQATQATEPGYQALNADLTAQYAPQLAAIDSAVQRQQALAGGETNLETIQGSGGAAARAASDLERSIDPGATALRDATRSKALDALNATNLSGLSPGEAAAVERGVNQGNTSTGNLGLGNMTNTISNALNFGGAFNSKIDRLNSTLGTANSIAQTPTTSFSPTALALGQPSTTGMTQFAPSGSQAAATGGALNFGSGLLGDQFNQNTAKIGAAASRANANSVPSFMGSVPSYS